MNLLILKSSWKSFLEKRGMKAIFFISFILLITALILYSNFLTFNELREGVKYNDPYLFWFTPINLTLPIFIIIYGGLILGIIVLIQHPKYLLLAIQTYSLIALVRIIAMYSLPLDPPPTNIALIDPFVQLFGTGETLMKDLFFSGHTSTMFMLFLTIPVKRLKTIYLIGTVLVGSAVLIQHTHYSVDVIAAPFFAYGCYSFAKFFDKRLFNIDYTNK
jgi:hypothetical protein